jgi:hypothetical protein
MNNCIKCEHHLNETSVEESDEAYLEYSDCLAGIFKDKYKGELSSAKCTAMRLVDFHLYENVCGPEGRLFVKKVKKKDE